MLKAPSSPPVRVSRRRHFVRGFTLVELISVIVIIGVLAGAAVPRFINMKRDARIASIQTLAAAMQTSATFINAKWYAAGKPATLVIGGATVPILSSGFPSAEYWDIPKWVTGVTYPLKPGAGGWTNEVHNGPNSTSIGWIVSIGSGWHSFRQELCIATYNGNTGVVTTNITGC